ncbi:MAG: PEP-CTERM sorting domain-containing protein [Kiritimatiellales bacterium]
MKRVRLIITVGMIVLCVGHTGVSQQPTVQNLNVEFWQTSHEWSEDAIWNNGVKPAESGSNVQMAAKPVNYTVTISGGAVTVLSFRSNYQTVGTDWTPTLLVSTNFTIDNFLDLGVLANGALVVANGGNVLITKNAARTLLGTEGYTGTLTVESGGIYETSGRFLIGTNGNVTVDGTLKTLHGTVTNALTIEGNGYLYIGESGVIELSGNRTGNAILQGYINDGQIYGADAITMAYDSVADVTRLTVVPEPGSVVLFIVGCWIFLSARKSLHKACQTF